MDPPHAHAVEHFAAVPHGIDIFQGGFLRKVDLDCTGFPQGNTGLGGKPGIRSDADGNDQEIHCQFSCRGGQVEAAVVPPGNRLGLGSRQGDYTVPIEFFLGPLRKIGSHRVTGRFPMLMIVVSIPRSRRFSHISMLMNPAPMMAALRTGFIDIGLDPDRVVQAFEGKTASRSWPGMPGRMGIVPSRWQGYRNRSSNRLQAVRRIPSYRSVRRASGSALRYRCPGTAPVLATSLFSHPITSPM